MQTFSAKWLIRRGSCGDTANPRDVRSVNASSMSFGRFSHLLQQHGLDSLPDALQGSTTKAVPVDWESYSGFVSELAARTVGRDIRISRLSWVTLLTPERVIHFQERFHVRIPRLNITPRIPGNFICS